jgi:myo-inositol 2-dehydrogenase/D-chiro-inositol 1-dehydrogenase
MIRIGVVGCGKIAEKHLNAYRKLSDRVEVTVTDVVPKGAAVAERFGASWEPNPERLIDSGSFDAIDVCTPTPSHAEVICSALRAGKHVFCEKPLARDLDEVAEIEAAARDADRTVMVGYLYRFHPAIRMAWEVIREGVIGEPYFATFRLGGRGNHKAWKHKAETGGGAGNEMLVHMLDLVLWYFGEAEQAINLYTATMLPEREIDGRMVEVDAEDIVLLDIETASGVKAFCQCDLVTPGYMNHIEVQGTGGSLFTSILDYLPTTVFCKQASGAYNAGMNTFSFAVTDVFERELGHFLDCIEGSAPDGTHALEDSRRLMEIVDAVLPPSRELIRPYVRVGR